MPAATVITAFVGWAADLTTQHRSQGGMRLNTGGVRGPAVWADVQECRVSLCD